MKAAVLSRTADTLFWKARNMERAVQRAQARCGEATTRRCAAARRGVFGQKESNDAV